MKLELAHVITEVKDLQFDMQQWIRGELTEDYGVISRRQAPDLTVINSKGQYETRNEFNQRYKQYYGRYSNAEMNVEIIRNKRISSEMLMVVYKQVTKIADKHSTRMTTAIFRYNPDLKNDAEWVHVHVTKLTSQ